MILFSLNDTLFEYLKEASKPKHVYAKISDVSNMDTKTKFITKTRTLFLTPFCLETDKTPSLEVLFI